VDVIVFSCPHCDTEIEVPDSKAGARASCGECGHRLQIPTPAKKSTKVTAHKPEPKPAAPPKAASKHPKRKHREEEDEDLPAKKATPVALWIGLGAAAVCAAGVTLFLLLRSNKTDAPPETVKSPPPRTVTNPNPVPVNQTPVQPVEEKKEEVGQRVAASGQEIYQHVLKSTVWIVNLSRRGISSGTGSLVDRQNMLVLTNNHVVDGNEALVVFFPMYQANKLVAERDTYLEKLKKKEVDAIRARVLKVDAVRDLALIQLQRVPEDFRALALAQQSVRQGDSVVSVGNPGGSGALWLYTPGTVRQVYHKKWKVQGGDRLYDLEADVVETQSATNPGDSGGPLVNDRGELVGVTEGGSRGAQLLSVFIDVKEATAFIEKTCQEHKLAWRRSTRTLVARARTGQVPDLIKDLGSPDAKVKVRAAQALAEMGPAARLAVSALVRALKDADELVRRLALDALTKIGTPDRADVPLLTQCLKDEDAAVRSYAAEAIGKVGADARSAGPSLLEALKDREAAVRQRAARSLGQVGTDNRQTVFPVLTAALKDPDLQVRVAAAEALTTVSPLQAGDLPLLLDMLKHQDVLVRGVAARAVGKLGAAARSAIPALTELVRGTPDREVRRAGIGALAQFGVEAREAIPALIEALKDEALRPDVIPVLGKMGAAAKDAVKALAEALSDANAATRASSLAALGKIGPDAKEAVPDLVKLLDGKDRNLRLQVLATLLQIGPGAEEAISALLRVAGETRQALVGEKVVTVADKVIHDRAVAVLAKIGKAAVKPLRQALRDRNDLLRLGAVTALGKIGPDARAAAQDLRALTVPQLERNDKVREAAATAYREVTAKPNKPSKPRAKPKKS
jgi:HEAT repeat protein/S1-C subfamily serine protease